MFAFLNRLTGRQPPQLTSPPPSASVPELSVRTGAAFSPQAREPEVPPTILQRDEILDAKTRICGYGFTVHSSAAQVQPSAQSMLDALTGANVAAFAERRLALIPLPAMHWMALDFRPLVGARTVFLLDQPGQSLPTEVWMETVAAIRSAGAKVALSRCDLTRHRDVIGACADILVIDFSAYALSKLEHVLSELRRNFPSLELVVENVGSWPERRFCVARGVAYCSGPFTTGLDDQQQTGEIGESRLVVMEMLNLLRRDADLADLAKVAKRDPGVAIRLVAMANAPIHGLEQSVTGIDQALMILGREQLYRWLTLIMFRAGADSPRDEVLLELALSRGRFLELLGRTRRSKAECEELFLVGLISLLDALWSIPLPKVVERLHLSTELKRVLLDGEGPLGHYLRLALAVERGQAEIVCNLARELTIPLDDIQRASAQALHWTEESIRSAP